MRLDNWTEELAPDEFARLEADWQPEWRLVNSRWGPMVVNRFDFYIAGALIHYGEYSRPEVETLRQLAQAGDVVLDIGANCGAIARPLCEVARSVVAFEPQPAMHRLLEVNARLVPHGAGTLSPIHCALGAAPGILEVPAIDYGKVNNFGGVALRDPTAKDGTPVPVRRLDDCWPLFLNDDARVGLIKVDVEGMETAVLEGGRELIRAHRPFLYVEADRKEHREQLAAILTTLGYTWQEERPPLFSPRNYFGNQHNAYGATVSINWLCWPVERPRPLLDRSNG